MRMDERVRKLAQTVVQYSLTVQPGESVLIEGWEGTDDLCYALMEEVRRVGGYPFVRRCDARTQRLMLCTMDEEYAKRAGELELDLIQKMQAYVAVRGMENLYEYSDVPAQSNTLYQLAANASKKFRMFQTKWCVLRYPTPAMAQHSSMSTEAFEDYFFDCCCADYRRMSEAARPLAQLMRKTDRVHITAPGTDLSFSIRSCCGETPFRNEEGCGRVNLPDGEVGGSVVKKSVQGTITYNVPSTYQGITFEQISFFFRDGRIYEASCSDASKSRQLNAILDTDEGARYIGEFSIGINPMADRAIGDTLFDEKMWGSFHFTPGHDPSAIHWDIVLSQRTEHGGGEIWFDDVLIRKDGLFVLPELKALNPENLLSLKET